MKKITPLLIMIISAFSLKAQITDSIPPVDFRNYMENLFSNINQTPVNTGILMEKGIVNIDFRNFDGAINNENISNFAKFRSVYEQLYYAHLDTSQNNMITPDSLANLYRWHNAEKTTAIGIALYDYNFIDTINDENEEPYFFY